jgi:hypothetical protein
MIASQARVRRRRNNQTTQATPARIAAARKLIGDIATGQVQDREDGGKDAAMSELRRQGGVKGGKARSEKLAPQRRSDIAARAAAARWKKP